MHPWMGHGHGHGKGKGWGKWGGAHGCGNKQEWKVKRAKIVDSPQEVMLLHPGQTKVFEVKVMNNTDWPWKQGCMIESCESVLPVVQILDDPVEIPVEQFVAGRETHTFKIPLSIKASAQLSEVPFHETSFVFRGPKGAQFGEKVVVKFKVVQRIDDIQIYQQAMDLKESQLQAFNFEEITRALKECSNDIFKAEELLKEKKATEDEKKKEKVEDQENKMDI